MDTKSSIVGLAAVTLAMASLSGLAQSKGQGKGGGGAAGRPQQTDRPRAYDRDRQQDRDRDRDRLHVQDPSQLKDGDIYGSQLMTEQERNQYRRQLQGAKTPEEQGQIRAQHREKMQARAKQQGRDLVPSGQGPIYGGAVMTVQERNEYREQLRLMDPGPEKQAFMAQHREEMRARAAEQGAQLDEVEEAE